MDELEWVEIQDVLVLSTIFFTPIRLMTSLRQQLCYQRGSRQYYSKRLYKAMMILYLGLVGFQCCLMASPSLVPSVTVPIYRSLSVVNTSVGGVVVVQRGRLM